MIINWTVEAIRPLLEQGEPLVLATIVSKSGSAPCLAGSKMIVRRDGSCLGTIGGGVLEAEGQRRGARALKNDTSEIFTFDLSGRDAANMNMICGGRVEVLIEQIAADKENRQLFAALAEALALGEKCVMVSDLGEDPVTIGAIRRCLVRADGSRQGTFPYAEAWLKELLNQAHRSTYPVLAVKEGRRFLVERCYVPSTLYVFGAGHVSRQLAELAQQVEFQTCVLDDRAEFANRERFPSVHEIKIIEDFADCMAGLEIDADSYLVIVTRGHDHDKTVLKQALATSAGYIGMLGSRKKNIEIRKLLLTEGLSEAQVERYTCPIGLDIGAETTAEIAVSIVAQLIKARAAKGAR
jgi:xanthine dehydrogenase accessory factor